MGAWLAALLVARAWAGCDAPVPADAIASHARAVWTAYLDVDAPTLAQARASLAASLPCAASSLSAGEAAEVHRARAVEAYADGDLEAVRRAFAALSRLDPQWHLPQIIRAPHPLAALWRDGVQRGTSPAVVSLDWTPAGGWWIDGLPGATPTVTLPAQRAFVLQVGGPDGVLRYSDHHVSDATVPWTTLWRAREQPALRARRRREIRLGTGLAGGALIATGIGLWAGGLVQADALRRDVVAPEAVLGAQARANALGGAGYATAGVGATLLAVGFAVPW